MRAKKLFEQFQPQHYELTLKEKRAGLIIKGLKQPPPSKRITLHQKGLKVIGAKIIREDKNGPVEFKIKRINHLPTFEQVRLHTEETLFPGRYLIELQFVFKNGQSSRLKKHDSKNLDRSLVPSIDEPKAWANATVEIKS